MPEKISKEIREAFIKSCDEDHTWSNRQRINERFDRAEQILAEGDLCPMTRKIFEKHTGLKNILKTDEGVLFFDAMIREAFAECIPSNRIASAYFQSFYCNDTEAMIKLLDKIREQEPLT